MNPSNTYEKELAFQADRRKATTEFIKIISDLWYDKSIEVVLFKNQIIDKNGDPATLDDGSLYKNQFQSSIR